MIGPAVDTATAYGRRLQQSTCVVEVPGEGEPVFDPETGTYDDPPPQVLYDGSCKIAPTGGARVVEFGEGPTSLKTYDVDLDGPVAGVPVGAVVRITKSSDPDLEDLELHVLEPLKGDTVTNRRLVCEEAT